MTDDADKLTDEDKTFLDKLSDRDKLLLEQFLTTAEKNYPKVLKNLNRIEEKLDHTIQMMEDLYKQHD